MKMTTKRIGAAIALATLSMAMPAETLPRLLAGNWRITRVLPTTNKTCWSQEKAAQLVGTTLDYRPDAMRWSGGDVPLEGITSRTLTSDQFSKENSGPETPADFAQLGIHTRSVTEFDMQHEDMDITGATTEVPGDSVLVVSPNRIVVSACGVYFEATRAAGIARTSIHR